MRRSIGWNVKSERTMARAEAGKVSSGMIVESLFYRV